MLTILPSLIYFNIQQHQWIIYRTVNKEMCDSANPVIHGDEIKYTRNSNEYRSEA